jgi:hypothetical protein
MLSGVHDQLDISVGWKFGGPEQLSLMAIMDFVSRLPRMSASKSERLAQPIPSALAAKNEQQAAPWPILQTF